MSTTSISVTSSQKTRHLCTSFGGPVPRAASYRCRWFCADDPWVMPSRSYIQSTGDNSSRATSAPLKCTLRIQLDGYWAIRRPRTPFSAWLFAWTSPAPFLAQGFPCRSCDWGPQHQQQASKFAAHGPAQSRCRWQGFTSQRQRPATQAPTFQRRLVRCSRQHNEWNDRLFSGLVGWANGQSDTDKQDDARSTIPHVNS